GCGREGDQSNSGKGVGSKTVAGVLSTKSKARSTKQTPNLNEEMLQTNAPFRGFVWSIGIFCLGICFVLRALDFVLHAMRTSSNCSRSVRCGSSGLFFR